MRRNASQSLFACRACIPRPQCYCEYSTSCPPYPFIFRKSYKTAHGDTVRGAARDANACKRMRTDANGCKRMQTHATAYDRMPPHATAYDRIPSNTIVYLRIPRHPMASRGIPRHPAASRGIRLRASSLTRFCKRHIIVVSCNIDPYSWRKACQQATRKCTRTRRRRSI